MKLKVYRRFKHFLRFICIAFLFPVIAHAGSHADVEEHIIETGSEFYYVVQKGDTLWDLSEKFSDSPWYWPDLWQQNPDIPNPHLIYPGQKIRIHRKTWEETRDIPEEIASVEIESAEPDQFYRYTAINAIGFIRETPAKDYGKVLKVKGDKRLISYGDKMFIDFSEADMALTEGSWYAVYSTTDPVNDPTTDAYIGIQYVAAGVVEVTEIQDDFAVATIEDSFRDIRKGDVILPFQERPDEIKLSDGVSGLTGKMIKGENDQALIGEHMVIFIDKGQNHAVEPGQLYTMYYLETAEEGRGSIDDIALTEETLGQILVLHTEETTSTALILNSKNYIHEGAWFKPAELSSR